MQYTKRIKEIRKKRNITQTEIAEKLNIKQTYYSKYEIGKITLPAEKLKEICEYLNISADYILGLTDEPRKLHE